MSKVITHPKIGIRPIIDGRRNGIRESLEERTMGMARAAAKLISENCFYPDGKPVECVIADTTIGGVAEAAECAAKFESAGVGASLSVTSCWCYGGETIDMNPSIPKAIWGFNGTERPGAVYLASAMAAHSQKGLPTFAIYGHDVQDLSALDNDEIPDDVKAKILGFARAALAVAQMRGKSYLGVGTVSMGIAGCIADEDLFRDYLGMRNEYVDSAELLRRMKLGIYDKDEYEKALKWVKANCREGRDNNRPEKKFSREMKDDNWETVVKMTIIMRDLMVGNKKLAEMGWIEESCGHHAILSGFQGQRQWTDWMPNGDFTEAMLNTSFDWNGKRAPYLCATENDSLNGVSMLLGYLLTNTASLFADVRTYWSPEAVLRVTGKALQGAAKDGVIHLINSGAATLDASGRCKDKAGKPVMKPFWDITDADMKACLEATEWPFANTDYMRGGGYSSRFLTAGGMPMTMMRINMVKGLGPVLQIAEGYSVELPDDVSEKLWERTDPTWPTTWFAPILTGKGAFADVYSVMNNWGANHGSINYGHIGGDLISLASMLRIPVCMHNVPAERIFRPAAWNMFGTADLESADYRACRAYGPLYGNI